VPDRAAIIDPFVSAMRAAFLRAAPSDASSCTLVIADRKVALHIAGAGLAATYLPALQHRVIRDDGVPSATASPPDSQPDRVDLTIGCWERSTTAVAPPAPPWSIDDFLPRGRIRGLSDDCVRLSYDEWSRTLTVYDREAREAFVHAADSREIPDWVARAPLRNVLTWWASDRGLAFLHASGVADEHSAVALAGGSGSGKSTTALSCLADGLALLGDDACIATLDGTPRLHPVYGFAKLEPEALERLPDLASSVVDPGAEQLLIEIPDGPTGARALRAVLLPQIAHTTDTRVAPVSPREALHALVAGSLLEGEGAGGTALSALTRLVQQVPCYRLCLGTERAGVVAAVRAVLRGRCSS
jgi:hypothetical protein